MLNVWIPFAALFGLLVGSFLNVCIHRLPRNESVVRPRSHCPECRHPLLWYENIPLASYLLQRGRCRHCRHPISLRYPTVELLTALLSVAIAYRFPDPVAYLAYFLMLSAPLLAITFIDLAHYLIPDVLSVPGIFLGFVAHLYLAPGTIADRALDSLAGIVVGGGILSLLAWLYARIRRQEGMGGGDIKLAAMIGAFFGWRAIIFILLASSLAGTLAGGLFLLVSRKKLTHPIPYGPFLALGAWGYLFFGRQVVDWYLSLTQRLIN